MRLEFVYRGKWFPCQLIVQGWDDFHRQAWGEEEILAVKAACQIHISRIDQRLKSIVRGKKRLKPPLQFPKDH